MGVPANQLLISGDSHMSEPMDLWEKNLPAKFRDQAPHQEAGQFYDRMHLRTGGWDGHERLKDMAVDGLAAEVLYPSDTASFRQKDPELEEACVHVYNEFIADFCAASPERLWGLGMISLRNIEHAIAELTYCKKAGLRGGNIWIASPHDLPYSAEHYERFWAAAQDLDMPLAMHINGRAEKAEADPPGLSQLHSVNGHKFDALTSLGHIIAGGVMERYPRLNFSVAEIGVGWVPFWLQELDYYSAARSKLRLKPSEYFQRQVTSTFISDAVGGHLLEDYEVIRPVAMWSSDYPHIASIWPDSRGIMEMDLGHLPQDIIADAVCNNAARVFNGGVLPSPADKPAEDYEADVRMWVKSGSYFGYQSRQNNAPEAGRIKV